MADSHFPNARLRCFVACWPDETTRYRLDRIAQDVVGRTPGARRVRAENLHLTLAFIGELPQPKARESADAVRDLAVEPFDWRIDHTGRFERAHVLWAGGPPEPRLEQLAERVRSQLRALQIRFETKQFAAHVTLLRDLPSRPPAGPVDAIEPFVWPVRSAVLLVSTRDAQGATCYRPLER